MEIVINKCYGGFGLSPLALKGIAKRKGKDLYFFKVKKNYKTDTTSYEPLTLEEAEKSWFCDEYIVPNPQDYDINKRGKDGTFKEANKIAKEITLPYFRDYENRSDEDLVAVVKELGEEANGPHAKLTIVDVPDNVDWFIDGYDGIETIREEHRTW